MDKKRLCDSNIQYKRVSNYLMLLTISYVNNSPSNVPHCSFVSPWSPCLWWKHAPVLLHCPLALLFPNQPGSGITNIRADKQELNKCYQNKCPTRVTVIAWRRKTRSRHAVTSSITIRWNAVLFTPKWQPFTNTQTSRKVNKGQKKNTEKYAHILD